MDEFSVRSVHHNGDNLFFPAFFPKLKFYILIFVKDPINYNILHKLMLIVSEPTVFFLTKQDKPRVHLIKIYSVYF